MSALLGVALIALIVLVMIVSFVKQTAGATDGPTNAARWHEMARRFLRIKSEQPANRGD
jgi:hypothetical protein